MEKAKPDPATRTFIKTPRRNRVNAIKIRVMASVKCLQLVRVKVRNREVLVSCLGFNSILR